MTDRHTVLLVPFGETIMKPDHLKQNSIAERPGISFRFRDFLSFTVTQCFLKGLCPDSNQTPEIKRG